MKLNLIAIFAAQVFFANSALATEYIYRDLMANTLPSPSCSSEKDAVENASKPYNISKYSKRFCQSQGYGWHVAEIKDNGKVVCQDCTEKNSSQKKCLIEDIVVSCKRIKPGSVGMLPGKS